ncbi:hypothetical protein [Asticcacaulis sp.]
MRGLSFLDQLANVIDDIREAEGGEVALVIAGLACGISASLIALLVF